MAGELEGRALFWLAASGAVAVILLVAAVRGLQRRRRRARRAERRRRNIAYSRAWDWLHGRKRTKRLTYRSADAD